MLTQDTPGVEDAAETGDRFGQALAAADFDGDGLPDLAAGIPKEDVLAVSDAGAVSVLDGSADGLGNGALVDQLWTQDSDGVEDRAERTDIFGTAVTAADFDGDGFADLAVGVPLEDIGPIRNAGSVNALYGGPDGLQVAVPADQTWSQDGPGVQEVAEPEDAFGTSLASDDFDGDGFADLVVGAVWEDLGAVADAGAINALYGTALGLQATAPDDQVWTQDSPDVEGVAEATDLLGWAIA